MARIVFSRASRNQIARLHALVAEAVLEALTLLEADPTTGKQLRGRLKGLWSMRIGSYRVIYEVRDRGRTVRIVAVLHRGSAYRSDPR